MLILAVLHDGDSLSLNMTFKPYHPECDIKGKWPWCEYGPCPSFFPFYCWHQHTQDCMFSVLVGDPSLFAK